jgi:hypothetical protein
MADGFRPVQQKKLIHCLCEVDVLMPHAAPRGQSAETGASLSVSTCLARCLAKAVDEYKAAQSCRQSGKDDVDIYMVIEHDEAGQRQIIPYTIPATPHMTLPDLHHEVRAVETSARTVGDVSDERVIVDDHTSVRVYLSHTISADHDIVDGAPEARFTERFKELIERGYGLDERPS